MDNPGPALRRRQAGARLRQLRRAAGKSMERVAAYLDCSVAKISRIETGLLLARVPDVRHMLDLYEVTGPERDELLDMVRLSRQKTWWHDHLDVITSDTYATFLGLHDAAVVIQAYQSYLLPDLLQTPDYTRAVLADHDDLTGEHVERVIRLRAAHQKAVLDRPRPPAIGFLIDEAALVRPVDSAATMSAQLFRIVEAASREHVTVQIVPFSAGLTPAYGNPFTLLEFADPGDPKAVYVQHLQDDNVETKPDTVDRYTQIAQRLRTAALTPAETLTDLTRRQARPTSTFAGLRPGGDIT